MAVFGKLSVGSLVAIILAIVFLCLIYKKVKEQIIKSHEVTEKREKQIDEALAAVKRYPEYRQQSINIQKKLEDQIQELKKSQELLRQTQEFTIAKLTEIEKDTKERERNKLGDKLIQNYRYYTNKQTNPEGTWTRMESEAFWGLFKEYEKAGGDGFMHSEVQPAMEKLIIIEH